MIDPDTRNPLAADDDLSGSVVFPPPSRPRLPVLAPPRGPGEIGWLGGYRVVREAGAGGMGVIYQAEDPDLRRTVALKVLRPGSADADAKERFLREARAAAALSSDHVVTVYRVGEADGSPYIAMEYLHGESLHQRLARGPALGLEHALVVGRQAAAGLAAAHAAGLVHRDIKPANLWLESDGPGGPFRRVKVLDFGLARLVRGEAGLTATGLILGTPNYMAPEQAEGKPVDARADLFSLGAVLYQVLTGEPAFPGDSVMAVLMALANRVPPPVSARNPAVPPPVADLVRRMLEKDPARRPAAAREVVAALDAALAALPPGLRSAAAPGASAAGALETPNPVALDTAPAVRPRRIDRRSAIGAGIGLVAGGGAVALFLRRRFVGPAAAGGPIPVGVLHSLTGTMGPSASPVADATLLAIDAVNQAGGVLGRPLAPVLADAKSDPAVFGAEAERLISQEKVSVIFGCWSSAGRKAVRTVAERLNGLLFYPVQYEGLEQSPRVVYLGPAPNQQLLPAVGFLTDALGKKRVFLVGSDYVFSRAAHEILKDWLSQKAGVAVAGEAFLPLGTRDTAPAVRAIREANPDAVVNTINGTTNFFFFKEMLAAGLPAEKLTYLSVSLTENELRGIDPRVTAGGYLAATYFQSVDRAENRAFVDKFRARFGADRVTSDMMAAAYAGVGVWAASAAAAGTPDPTAVLAAARGREYPGPAADIRIDPETQHTWRPWRIGRVRADGQVDIVAEAPAPVRPEPFPPTRTRRQWEQYLNDLYVGWDGQWQAPAKP